MSISKYKRAHEGERSGEWLADTLARIFAEKYCVTVSHERGEAKQILVLHENKSNTATEQCGLCSIESRKVPWWLRWTRARPRISVLSKSRKGLGRIRLPSVGKSASMFQSSPNRGRVSDRVFLVLAREAFEFQSSPNRGRVSDAEAWLVFKDVPDVSVLSKSRKGLGPRLWGNRSCMVTLCFSPLQIEEGSRTQRQQTETFWRVWFQSSPNRGRVSDPPRKFVMGIKGLQGRLHFVGSVNAILPVFIFELRSKSRCFTNSFNALHVLHFLHGGMRVSAF